MTDKQTYNKKSVAAIANCDIKTLNKEIQIMLQDPTLASEFGYYSRKRFTRKQIKLMRENIAILDCLTDINL